MSRGVGAVSGFWSSRQARCSAEGGGCAQGAGPRDIECVHAPTWQCGAVSQNGATFSSVFSQWPACMHLGQVPRPVSWVRVPGQDLQFTLGRCHVPCRPILELLVVPVLTAPSPQGAGKQSWAWLGRLCVVCATCPGRSPCSRPSVSPKDVAVGTGPRPQAPGSVGGL